MSDDLVERARHNALADMPHYASVELIEAMAARIEELEAKLAKAVEALQEIVVDDTWGLDHVAYMKCRKALKATKGQDDE